MRRALRNLLDGYRRIGSWTGRVLVSLCLFTAVALAVVWPLWALATGAPRVYALLVAALAVAGLGAAVVRHRRRARRDTHQEAPRDRARFVRIAAAVVTPMAAYAALVVLQSGSALFGAFLAFLALVALGTAGSRVARK